MIKRQVLISQQKELATDNNVVTKSGKDNNAIEVMNKMKEAKKMRKAKSYKVLKQIKWKLVLKIWDVLGIMKMIEFANYVK